jgi:hypothetical protein
MKARPRHRLAQLRGAALPARPGVYSLWRDGEAVYVGKAKSLADRLGKAHRGRSQSMGSSALRRNVAEHLGIATAAAIKDGAHPVTREEADRVNAWLDGCKAAWVEARSEEAALKLEKALKREWRPLLTKV